MKAAINPNGVLIISAGSEADTYALRHWYDNFPGRYAIYTTADDRFTSVDRFSSVDDLTMALLIDFKSAA
jgi:hypothetical protein